MMKKSRLPLFQREKERHIGKPILRETTYNQDHLRNASDLRAPTSHPKAPRFLSHPYEQQEQWRSPNALVPPPKPFGNEVRISATPTEHSVYSQGQSNYGYDYYAHPTTQTGNEYGNPSPPISPLLDASPDERTSLRSVSPIREPLSRSTAPPRTPEQPQSRFSFATTARTSPGSSSWSTIQPQSRFSMSTTASPQSKYSLERSTVIPQSKFSADSTPQSTYSPQFSYAPTPRHPAPLVTRRPRAASVAESVATVATNVTAATTRKPVPVPQRAASPAPSVQTNATMMTNATAKNLPQPPVLVDPFDRTSVLQAELDDLHIQKGNLNRIIEHLKKPQPQNPLISDIASRRDIERNLQELQDQLHDITTKIHETGISLIKAYKRKDKDNPEASHHWVKRVTSDQFAY